MLSLCAVGCSAQKTEEIDKKRLPIVTITDPTKPIHIIALGKDGPTIGFSDNGGGYIYFVDIGEGNICEPKYGRGWQSAIRDWLHWGRYNPTQGGFSATAGVPVQLVLDKNSNGGERITVEPFNVPLFADPVFDFTEHEDLVPDWVGYEDNDHSDTDGLDESNWTQDDELRSEFDFHSTYEDASHIVNYLIPVMRQRLTYMYKRDPRAILQFGKGAKQHDGSAVIREAARVNDISPNVIGGAQEASDVDLGLIVFVTQELRVVWEAKYRTAMWLDEEDQWQSDSIRSGRLNFIYVALMEDQNMNVLDNPAALPIGPNRWTSRTQKDFALLSTGTDPDSADAIAIYVPHASSRNSKPVIGVDITTNDVIYEEDRRMRHYAQIARVADNGEEPGFAQLGMYLNLTGLLAPTDGRENIIEGLRQEVYVLFGSPNQIREATALISRSYETRSTDQEDSSIDE